MHKSKQPDSPLNKRAPLPVPPAAQAIHLSIIERLKELNNGIFKTCKDPSFQQCWEEIAVLFENYQRETSNDSRLQKTCKEGCAACCCHWVDEVRSFEAEIIADFLRKNCKAKIPSVIDHCREDIAVLGQLNGLVDQKLSVSGGDEKARIDAEDLLLSVFYQMGRPCPLLEKGACIAYGVRPLTCRGYVSFSDARYCDPEHINDGKAATYLFGFEDDAMGLIEKLDEKFRMVEGEYGLRKLLVKYLEK